jgi:hypothetical protein
MNSSLLICAGLLTFTLAAGQAQPATNTFTKITQGAIVNDLGKIFVRGVWADFNNDGYLDLFVNDKAGTNVFYLNNRDGTFTKITQGPEIAGSDNHSLPSWVDYDNDGHFDLTVPVGFEGSPSHVQLFAHGGNATFTLASAGDLTSQSGYFGLGAWADYDNDGFTDFAVTSLPRSGSGKNLLFHNNGDGTFTKVSAGAVTTDPLVPASLVWCDYDNDGFMDLFVVSASPDPFNRLYHNNRDGTFTPIQTNTVANDQWPLGGQGNAAAWGDYDNDGLPDLFIAASSTPNRLYHNDGAGSFTKVTSGPMLPHAPGVAAWGCAWGDYDNDGHLDLFVANANGNNQLFRNNGDGTFTAIVSDAPVNEGGPGITHLTPSWVDYDNDGALDLFVAGGLTDQGTPVKNLLYRNNGNTNAWLKVNCIGTVSNRAAIGAKVRVRATIRGKTFWQVREVNEGGGHSSLPPVVHFGLGDATNVETLRIEWPSGILQEIQSVPARQTLTFTEPPRLSVLQTEGIPQIILKGGRGFSYLIQTSTNLGSWADENSLTITNFSGTTRFDHPLEPTPPVKFYRAVSR